MNQLLNFLRYFGTSKRLDDTKQKNSFVIRKYFSQKIKNNLFMLGQKLKLAIENSEFTKAEFAEILGMSEANLFKLFKKDTFEISYLRVASKKLGLPLSYFLEEYDYNSVNTKNNDSMPIVEFLRKENDFLRGFIKEKFAVNFNGGGLMPTYGTVFFGANNP